MNEIEFKNWLSDRNINSKVKSDIVSRLKRIEREIDQCDIDEQYRIDRCTYLMNLFSNRGNNAEMKKYPYINLPVGKYSMNTYKYALNQYVKFSDTIKRN